MEDGGSSGSAGSHWEKTFLPNEYMNPTIEYPGVISAFTFAVLKGSGWYKVDLEDAEHYNWGKDDGCEHFSICPKGGEYCKNEDINEWVCTPDFKNKAICSKGTTFNADCPVKRSN